MTEDSIGRRRFLRTAGLTALAATGLRRVNLTHGSDHRAQFERYGTTDARCAATRVRLPSPHLRRGPLSPARPRAGAGRPRSAIPTAPAPSRHHPQRHRHAGALRDRQPRHARRHRAVREQRPRRRRRPSERVGRRVESPCGGRHPGHPLRTGGSSDKRAGNDARHGGAPGQARGRPRVAPAIQHGSRSARRGGVDVHAPAGNAGLRSHGTHRGGRLERSIRQSPSSGA